MGKSRAIQPCAEKIGCPLASGWSASKKNLFFLFRHPSPSNLGRLSPHPALTIGERYMQTSWLTDSELWKLLEEDVPVMDLTSLSLRIGGRKGEMEFFLRKEGIVAGVEEAARLPGLSGLEVSKQASSGRMCQAGAPILSCRGEAGAILRT